MKQCFKIIKIAFIIVLTLSLLSPLYARQKTSDLDFDPQVIEKIPRSLFNIISLDLKEVSLVTALNEIAVKGDIKFNYAVDRIPSTKKVTVRMSDVAALEALVKILKDTDTGLIITNNGQIAIVPKSEANVDLMKKRNINDGEIKGTVKDAESGEPLIGANIVIVGTYRGAATDRDGNFQIPNLNEGTYIIEASYVGYEKRRFDNIVIEPGRTVNLDVELTESILSLREIVVTPGQFTLMEKAPSTSNSLKSEAMRSFPQIGEDIYRAATRLPGISGSDFSSRFSIRGGSYEEILVQLDGMELYDPFHLKDIDGFLSIIDVEAISSIDMMTGAFPAEYGNRLSGVFNMKTVTPTEDNSRTSAAISFMNARFLSQGTFNNSRGNWLFLARRGYIDMLLKAVQADESGDKVEPVYYDILSKLQYYVKDNHSLSVNVLSSIDDTDILIDDEDIKVNTKYDNHYGWLTWDAQFTDDLFATSLLYTGTVDKVGFATNTSSEDVDFIGSITDNRGFGFYGFKQDWSLSLSENHLIKWGINSKRVSANNDFIFINQEQTVIAGDWDSEPAEADTSSNLSSNDGTELGLYLSDRFRPVEPLTVEIGLRYDHASWTKDNKISPRLNLVYNFNKNTVFRAGWGMFFQSQGVHQSMVQDGDDKFYESELATHYNAGLEHKFKNGVNLRLEAYYKDLSNLRPHYINYQGALLNLFEFAHPDRIRLEPESGSVRGYELFLNKDIGSKFSWWFSYGFSKVEEKINGRNVPRQFDQHHTVYIDLNYRPSDRWSLNLAWNYHTGWPHTETRARIVQWLSNDAYEFEWYPGPLMNERFPDYHRMDIRITKFFDTSHGRLSTFLEVRNLYNRENTSEYVYSLMGYWNGRTQVRRTGNEGWLPMMPSFGISWDF